MSLRFVRAGGGVVHVARRQRGRERGRTRFCLADIAELFVLVLLALRTIGLFVQIVVQSYAATARSQIDASKILAQRPVHNQGILRRRSYDNSVALPPVSSILYALLRVVQQAEGITYVDDQADILLVQPERQGDGGDYRTTLRAIELSQHLALVRQLRVIAQAAQLLS
jgi:hypothetical protein